MNMNLRTKVSLMILLPAIAIIAISSVLHYHSEREEALATMSLLASQTGDVIERAIQHDMLESDFKHIQRIFDDIGEDPRIGSLLLLDLNGQVKFSPNQVSTGQVLSNQDGSCLPCHNLDASNRPSGIVTSAVDGERFFRSMHPIDNLPECHQCHDPEQRIIGVLLTDFSIEPIEQILATDLRGNLIWWAVTALLILLIVNFAIRRWVITRIDDLHHAMEGFGRFPQPQDLAEGSQDEIGRLAHTFNVMVKRISKRDTENQALSDTLQKRNVERGELLKQIITTQEDERIRVARELHDELGQSLSSTALQIEMAKRTLATEEAPIVHLDQANSLLKDATDQMYDLISGLRPSALDDLGLEAAFKSLAKRTLEPAGIKFTIDCSESLGRLPPEIEIVIYRVFQEAFTNVLRYAQASEVTLSIKVEDRQVLGEMVDNGIGFDLDNPPETNGRSTGLGLVGMRERVEQCDGEFSVDSKRGEGTRILVHLPNEGNPDGR
jgi:signal transduction histidine kinase